MTDTTTALMIHVERIVRPLRATSARKLRMRRELLAHLQSALDEERERIPDQPAAIAAALKRLGDPAELRRSLDASVPRIEKLFLFRFRSPARMHAWGERSNREMGIEGMTLLPTLLAGISGTLLAYCAPALNALYFGRHYRDVLEVALGNHTPRLQLGMLACAVLSLAPMVMAFHVIGRRARAERLGWKDAALAAAFITASLAWMSAAILSVGSAISWPPLAVSIVTALLALAALSLLGRWVRTVPRPHTEWLRLPLDA
ncbi:MAG TPA: hypothetical protein VH253_16700 [Phycisphaerae bacterium]|nr:hypothetical protein [Phycisphaerae bacterium]